MLWTCGETDKPFVIVTPSILMTSTRWSSDMFNYRFDVIFTPWKVYLDQFWDGIYTLYTPRWCAPAPNTAEWIRASVNEWHALDRCRWTWSAGVVADVKGPHTTMKRDRRELVVSHELPDADGVHAAASPRIQALPPGSYRKLCCFSVSVYFTSVL